MYIQNNTSVLYIVSFVWCSNNCRKNLLYGSGRLLKSLADIKSSSQKMGTLEIVYNVVGLCMMVSVTVAGTIYGRRALRELEISEEARDCEVAELKDSEGGNFDEPSKELNVASVN